MRILAIDTATEACSAALYIDDVLTHEYQLAPREHTKLILKMVESLLSAAHIKLADLDALAFGCGPGSFTGVRIATGVVQGLGFASDLPVIPISTLASIAQRAYEDYQHEFVIAGIDARMNEMYWGYYQLGDNGLMSLHGKEQVSGAEELLLPADLTNRWCGAGSAWDSYADNLEMLLGDQLTDVYADYLPHASTIARLAVAAYQQGLAVPAAQALPVYLRNDVAKKKSAQGK